MAHIDDVKRAREPELMAKANVIGVAKGRKNDVGPESIRVFVRRKLPLGQLNAADVIPTVLDDEITDVVEMEMPRPQAAPTLRPGASIGHEDVTAGTLGAMVIYQGMLMMLSNNHVLADTNQASIGDPIHHPGLLDDPSAPIVGHLFEFEPIVLSDTASNEIDAAVATVSASHCLYSELLGRVNHPVDILQIGDKVLKHGRTTTLTIGEVTDVDATILIDYGAAEPARFINQLITGPMSQGGDSGSLVRDRFGHAAGLIFAGTEGVRSIVNPISAVINRFTGMDFINLPG